MNVTSEDHLYFETCMSLEVSKLYIQIYMYIKLTLFLKHYSTVTGVTAIMVPVDYNTSPGNQYSPPQLRMLLSWFICLFQFAAAKLVILII